MPKPMGFICAYTVLLIARGYFTTVQCTLGIRSSDAEWCRDIECMLYQMLVEIRSVA